MSSKEEDNLENMGEDLNFYEPHPEQSEQENLCDLFDEDDEEDARREEVLRQINQAPDDPRQQHEQLNQILDRREKREQKQAKRQEQQKLKKLRQRNALQFFRKVKALVLLNFKDSIIDAERAKVYYKKEQPKYLSFFRFETLSKFQELKEKLSKQISRKQFIGLLQSVFGESKLEFDGRAMKYKIIWAMAIELGVGFRMMRFIDITSLELEAFYNLKYQPAKKKQKKPSKKLRKSQKSRSKKSLSSLQLENIDLDSVSQSILQNSLSQIDIETAKNEKQVLYNKTFRQSFCEIYCPIADNWVLFNMETLQCYPINDLKIKVLDGKAIIGFYSVRILNFRDQYQFLARQRNYGSVEFRDHTVEYCDKIEQLQKRRRSLGCKNLYREVIRESTFFKTLQIFKQFDQFLVKKSNKEEEDYALEHFPKNPTEMRASQLFVVPSLIQKYMVLKEGAKPFPDLEFREEKVYSKKDLVKVSSKMGWVDQFRMVRQGEQPVKITETMRKVTTKLYLFTQTEPFRFKFTEDGDFVLDQEYNSIYVPPSFTPPEGYTLVPFNVEYISKRNGYKCARIVQGFDVAGWHLIPNNIGFLVEEGRREQIEQLYYERQAKLKEKKESKKEKDALGFWRKLFKSIIITQKV